jgi:hypothetical protein
MRRFCADQSRVLIRLGTALIPPYTVKPKGAQLHQKRGSYCTRWGVAMHPRL